MDFVEEQLGKAVPQGWSVKSRCRPDLRKCIDELLGEMQQLEERVRRRAQKAGIVKEEESNMKTAELQKKLLKAFEDGTKKEGPQVEEEEVKRMRKLLQGFVVAPVDKLSGDAAIM